MQTTFLVRRIALDLCRTCTTMCCRWPFPRTGPS